RRGTRGAALTDFAGRTVNRSGKVDVDEAVTMTDREPVAASLAIEICARNDVEFPPGRIVAVTPVPPKASAVAPPRVVPVILATNVLPGAPDDGSIPVIVGWRGLTVNGSLFEPYPDTLKGGPTSTKNVAS